MPRANGNRLARRCTHRFVTPSRCATCSRSNGGRPPNRATPAPTGGAREHSLNRRPCGLFGGDFRDQRGDLFEWHCRDAFGRVKERKKRRAIFVIAGGGNRTRTPLARPRILRPVRLPVPPPRHVG